jgi:Ni,Fe-hydrogenase I cytochrome b subunit
MGTIILVLGAMVLHNLVLWRSKVVAKRKLAHATVVRMTLNQRVQHWILLVCFAALVLSGFALIYPFSTVADWVGITDPIRRSVHRTAGWPSLCLPLRTFLPGVQRTACPPHEDV